MTTEDSDRRLTIRLANHADDLAAAQRLRWRVFMADGGTAAGSGSERDQDPFDTLCDHLLVVDERGDAGQPLVVGTYRLLRQSVAARNGGFYSAGEFDLAPLMRHSAEAGELLELGRSCVLPAYRTSQTIALLWHGIARYLGDHAIGAMFGCASFAGTDPAVHAASLSLLAHRYLAPADRRPGVLQGKGIALAQLPSGSYDERRALLGLPPLVKGYIRAGARFGDGAFVDHAFGTIDVCVLLPVQMVSKRYATRFNVAA